MRIIWLVHSPITGRLWSKLFKISHELDCAFLKPVLHYYEEREREILDDTIELNRLEVFMSSDNINLNIRINKSHRRCLLINHTVGKVNVFVWIRWCHHEYYYFCTWYSYDKQKKLTHCTSCVTDVQRYFKKSNSSMDWNNSCCNYNNLVNYANTVHFQEMIILTLKLIAL